MMGTRIYVFCNARDNGRSDWHPIIALAEDGAVVAQHICSQHGYAQHDMGFTSEWKHAEYNAHYPDGWELEWVEDVDNHAGFAAAMERNKALGSRHREGG